MTLYFYPRSPRGGRLDDVRNPLKLRQISIHALREEGDERFDRFYAAYPKFLSTPSARRATCHQGIPGSAASISIHALREEGDPFGMSLNSAL